MNDYLRDRVTAAVGGQYLIENEVGRGAMAVVYRATDLRLHRLVAVKVLPPDLAFNADVRERFVREAQTAAQLSHPNIVPIYSVDEAEGISYFVMAFVDGESLGVRVAREGAWPIDQTTRVLRDVADALAYAHARGIVHRDIKPDNILIDRASGRPMVTDFGIARAAAGETRLTITGVAVGTPAYMSPEQALGEREIDGRSDLYSLAVVGYQLLTGDTPFKAGNTPAMLVKHVSERPRPVREHRAEIPAFLSVAIDRSLAKRPEDRWTGAAEFRDALDGAQSSHRSSRERSVPLDRAAVAAESLSAQRPPPSSPQPAPFPDPPPGLTRRELRRWYRAQHRVTMRTGHPYTGPRDDFFDEQPLENRVLAFRRSAVSFVVVAPTLVALNLAMHVPFPWSLFADGFLLLNVLRKAGSIWSDGVGPLDAFKKGIRTKLRAERGLPPMGTPASALAAAPPTTEQLATQLAPAEVLAGSYGETVRRAASDRAVMRGIVDALRPIERSMIPDVAPTLDQLATRVGSLAATLHRLDADVSGASLGALDERIAQLSGEPDTKERERRLVLLQRQRTSLHELLERRQSLVNQLESSALMLQNLKLDLLKFRSSGVGSAIEDEGGATQEVRALSREIGRLVETADDLRKL